METSILGETLLFLETFKYTFRPMQKTRHNLSMKKFHLLRGTFQLENGIAILKNIHMSHEKNPYYFPLYWLVNKDPYNCLL